jgi:DNA-dependent RNA polymerase auxiliary subunit epsilon
MRYSEFSEALKPSEYRNLVRGWDKTRYAELFGGRNRIYLPLEAPETANTVRVNPQVGWEVERAGYKIDDYVKGIASKTDGGRVRQIKIGKLLTPAAAQVFANDPARQATKKADQLVVISRHPYDIAGMSTDRGWRSCMNLRNHGKMTRFVPLDIAAGTVIAYLIDADDKNINHPQARMLIKPFVNILGDHQVALGIENQIYGSAPPTFSKTVSAWVKKINDSRQLDGIFELDPRLYHDIHDRDLETDDNGEAKKVERPRIVSGPSSQRYEQLMNDPIGYIRAHPDADDVTRRVLISYNPNTIEYMANPSPELQMLAVKENYKLIKYVENPSFDLQQEVVSANPFNIQYITNPSDQIKEYAFQKSDGVFPYIKNPPLKMQQQAVEENPYHIMYIDNPSPEMQLSAVQRLPGVYEHIKNPTPEVQAVYAAYQRKKRWG